MSAWIGEGELRIRAEWCKGCGICVALCPRQVLALDERGKVQLVAEEACTACRICEVHCPDFVLSVVRGGGNLASS